MGRNNADFEEGKDHIVIWTGDSGDTYQQEFPTSKLNKGVDKQKAVGKYIASSPVEKPAKGSKVKWKAKNARTKTELKQQGRQENDSSAERYHELRGE